MKALEQTTSLVTLGTEAYARIMRTETWTDWLAVGRAIEAGRNQTMRELRTNNPQGRIWAERFGAWLKNNGKSEGNPGGFAAIDKAVRSRLQSCMDHLGEIELWRQSVGATKAQEWQHPVTVWRHFSAALKPKAEAPQSPAAAKARSKDNLEMSVERLEQVADSLEAPRQLAFDLTSGEMGAEAAQTFFDVYGAEEGLKAFVQTLHALLIRQDYPEIVRPVATIDPTLTQTDIEPADTIDLQLDGYVYRVVGGKDVSVQKHSRAGRPYFQRVRDQRRIARVLKAAK